MRDRPPTPEHVLEEAYEVARKKLKYVYIGNVWGNKAEHTYCPECRNILIWRVGFTSEIRGLKGDRCSECGYRFFGVLPIQ